jgi:hypothetical protein
MEVELLADTTRAKWPEHSSRRRDRRRVLDDERESHLHPALGELGLDEPPLIDGSHRRISIMAGR